MQPIKCSHCEGEGKFVPAKYRCGTCQGKKVCNDRKVLEVHIDPGMTEGTKIPFRGYADEKPGVEPGDVVIVIMEKEHHLFQRKGNELIVKLNISLSEALTGFWNGFLFLFLGNIISGLKLLKFD